MKRWTALLLLVLPIAAGAQNQPKDPTTLRGVLLEELRSTHNQAEWFVPANTAVAGLTAEQAAWSPGQGNHSVGQLTYHLWFWDEQALRKFKGEKAMPFSGNNDDTFNNFDPAHWDELVKKLDATMTEWEKAVESADDAKLAANAATIARVSTHNAYHIGEILYVRKLHGMWDPNKGVK